MDKLRTESSDWSRCKAKISVRLLDAGLGRDNSGSALDQKFLFNFNTLSSVVAIFVKQGMGFGMVAGQRKYR